MKLLAFRARDRADIEDLVAAGADVPAIRAYVAPHLPDRVVDFDAIVQGAESRR